MFQFWLTVLIPILLGSFIIACSNLIKRHLLKDKEISALQFLIVGFGLMSIFCGMIYIALWELSLPPLLLPKFWNAVFICAAANLIIQFLNAKAASLDKGEVSLTAPLQSMTPFLITLLALTLGELPGRIGVMGIFFMMCGSYVLLWVGTPQHWYDYLGPVQRVRMIFRRAHITPAEWNKTLVVCMALGSATMGTIGILSEGLFTRRGVDMQGLILAIMITLGSLSVGYTLWYLVKPDATPTQRRNFFAILSRRNFALMLTLFAIFWLTHWLLIQPTYQHAFVAYVGTLKRFHILFGVVLGHLVFHESQFKQRLWASILIIAGAILISMDGLPARVTDKIIGLGF